MPPFYLIHVFINFIQKLQFFQDFSVNFLAEGQNYFHNHYSHNLADNDNPQNKPQKSTPSQTERILSVSFFFIQRSHS